jgi:hypothetical protein
MIASAGLMAALSPITATGEEPPASLDAVSWMAGHWRSVTEDVVSEEAWLAPKGGVMLGVHRDVRPDRRAFFEYLRIEARAERLVYVASPMGRGTTEFVLVELEGSSAVFANPDHDFPQRIEYTREGDRMTARAEGRVDGRQRSEQWVWELMP